MDFKADIFVSKNLLLHVHSLILEVLIGVCRLMSIVTSGGVTEWRPFYTAGILLKFIDSHLASLSGKY